MAKMIITTTLMIIAIFFVCASGSYAITIDRTVDISAGGEVPGSTSLYLNEISISYDNNATTDMWPKIPAGAKVRVTYTSNYNPWKIRISTNNTTVPMFGSTDGRYSKGGLISPTTGTAKNVVPCKWVAKVGGTLAPSISTIGGYNFIKDKRDEDDPATMGNNESWASAEAAGYPNIAYGTANGFGFCVDPTNSAPGPNQFKGDVIHGIIDLFIAGLFGTGGVTPAVQAAAGDYGTTFIIELFHE